MKLIKPALMFYKSYLEAINESKGLFPYATDSFFNPINEDLFVAMDNYEKGINLPSGYVPATFLWLIDKDEFIGVVNIRHHLTSSLLNFGGNIGYAIRHSKWNQGYGTFMLNEALKYCKNTLHLDKVMLTCHNENIASKKVIEKNGGILQDISNVIVDNKEINLRRYWIFLEKKPIRIVGVVIKDNKILCQREKDKTEYALPGGHLEANEGMIECLKREFIEEQGIKIDVNRLLWIENSCWNHQGHTIKSVNFYFLVSPNHNVIPDNQIDNLNILFEWLPVSTLDKYEIYPSFLKDELEKLYNGVKLFDISYN